MMMTRASTTSTTVVATMTDRFGRSARWGTAAIVAPLAAAALAVATSWGVAHPPDSSGKNTSSDKPSDDAGRTPVTGHEPRGIDKSMLVLQRTATAEQVRVIRLQKRLHLLHARTRALSRAPLPSSREASAGGVVAAPPRVSAQAPAPAPAPATHASTGAS